MVPAAPVTVRSVGISSVLLREKKNGCSQKWPFCDRFLRRIAEDVFLTRGDVLVAAPGMDFPE